MIFTKKIGFYLLTAILITLAAAFCIGTTAISQSRISQQAQQRYEREQRKILVEELRDYLDELGYQNSGITLSGTTHEDGNHTYTAKIHHPRIDRMQETQRQQLKNKLTELTTAYSPITIFHEFLITNP